MAKTGFCIKLISNLAITIFRVASCSKEYLINNAENLTILMKVRNCFTATYVTMYILKRTI